MLLVWQPAHVIQFMPLECPFADANRSTVNSSATLKVSTSAAELAFKYSDGPLSVSYVAASSNGVGCVVPASPPAAYNCVRNQATPTDSQMLVGDRVAWCSILDRMLQLPLQFIPRVRLLRL
jgi:hypothetical protein